MYKWIIISDETTLKILQNDVKNITHLTAVIWEEQEVRPLIILLQQFYYYSKIGNTNFKVCIEKLQTSIDLKIVNAL